MIMAEAMCCMRYGSLEAADEPINVGGGEGVVAGRANRLAIFLDSLRKYNSCAED
jgi:hypothetical protein